MLLLWLAIFVVFTAAEPHSNIGAIVTLLHGDRNENFTALIDRNKSLMKYLWTENMHQFDIVLFHEPQLPPSVKDFIQQATPNLPLKFVPVDFDGHAVYDDPPKNTTIKLIYNRCYG